MNVIFHGKQLRLPVVRIDGKDYAILGGTYQRFPGEKVIQDRYSLGGAIDRQALAGGDRWRMTVVVPLDTSYMAYSNMDGKSFNWGSLSSIRATAGKCYPNDYVEFYDIPELEDFSGTYSAQVFMKLDWESPMGNDPGIWQVPVELWGERQTIAVPTAFYASRSSGLYISENWTYDDSVPVWKQVGQSFGISDFDVDPSDPGEFQVARSGYSIYVRRPTHYGDENWHEVLTKTQAESVIGATLDSLDTAVINPQKPGYMYTLANDGINATGRSVWILRSSDYGQTWDYALIRRHTMRRYGHLAVGNTGGGYDPGTVMYASINFGGGGSGVVHYSVDGGSTWTEKEDLGLSIWLPRVMIAPDDQGKSYSGRGINGINLCMSPTPSALYTEIDGALEAGISCSNTHGHGWVKGDLIRTVRSGNIYLSDDGGATWEYRAAGFTTQNIWAPGDGNDDYVAVAARSGADINNPQNVKSSTDRGVTWHNKSGANPGIAGTGGGDSIPYDCGGVAQNGFQVHLI